MEKRVVLEFSDTSWRSLERAASDIDTNPIQALEWLIGEHFGLPVGSFHVKAEHGKFGEGTAPTPAEQLEQPAE